jgi:dTDP-4-amino-4,6-dideoxygalactose transaminase/dephospho-CoA kinase
MVRFSKPWIEEDDIAAVVEVMRGTHLTQGPAIGKYENALQEFLGARYAVAVSSGTAALHLAVAAENPDSDTWGFVPSITFSASINCFWYNGVKNVVIVDVDPVTGQMTPQTLEEALKRAPLWARKIAIPVSLAGLAMDWAAFEALARRYNCTLIEDAAQSLGGTYTVDGETYRSGSASHTSSAILSTHAVKQLCTGEGGAYVTNDPQKADKVRLLRSHGIVRPSRAGDPYWYSEQIELGYHYRLTDMQAALGASQLKKLDARRQIRERIAAYYDGEFSKAEFLGRVTPVPSRTGHAYHLYLVHLSDEVTRNACIDYCKEHGYSLKVNHEPLSHMPYHSQRAMFGGLPGTEAYYKTCLTLAIYPQMTFDEMRGMVEVLREFFMTRRNKTQTVTVDSATVQASTSLQTRKGLRVALTGGMACGKTTIFTELQKLGWKSVSMDELVRKVFFSDAGQDYLAAHSCHAGVRPTRDEHRNRYSSSPEYKKYWDDYVQGRIQSEMMETLSAEPNANWVVEYPMLFEHNRQGFFDKVVLVDAPDELSKARWVASGRSADNYEKNKRYMIPSSQKRLRADIIIENNGSMDELRAKAGELSVMLAGTAAANA